MIDATKIGVGVRKRRVVPVNLSLRVAGGFYAAYGALALGKLLEAAPVGGRGEVNLFACLILAAFTVFGLVLCLSVESLVVDPVSSRYEYRKGVWPFVKSTGGSVGEIRSIAVERVQRNQNGGDAPDPTPSAILSVKILWTDTREPIELFSMPDEALFGSNRARVTAKARRIAVSLGIPLAQN